MGRSQIIRDLANGIIDATTALKRTKVLLHFLNKDDNVIKWIKSELEGYGDTDEVPYYRTWDGQLRGTYICGTAYSNIRGKNQPLPVGNLSKEIRERILSINIRDIFDKGFAKIFLKKHLSAVFGTAKHSIPRLSSKHTVYNAGKIRYNVKILI